MNRMIKATFLLSIAFTTLSLSKTSNAGFEWVPPEEKPTALPKSITLENQPQASYDNPQNMNSGSGFPAPSVTAEPLDNNYTAPQTSMPTSIVPDQQQMAPHASAKKISGNKLFIDPFPLDENKTRRYVSQPNPTEVYKAMNEKAELLHPIKLGNGLSTGAKSYKAAPVPKAVRTASTAHKTFLTPTGTGNNMTPMMGAEPAPLPGYLPQASTPQVEQNRLYAEAVGFGRDLPLALALSQVIPSEFTHSFSKDVNPGVTVSWEGGKPWNVVLNEMLSDKNLTAVIRNNQVTIQPTARL